MSDRPSTEHSANASEAQQAAVAAECLEEALLGRPATMDRAEVSRVAQVPLLSARKFWHSLGFPLVQSNDEMFTETDVEALQRVARLVREGTVDEELALGMTRAIARTTDRLAVWQTQLVAESLTEEREEVRGGLGGLTGVGGLAGLTGSSALAAPSALSGASGHGDEHAPLGPASRHEVAEQVADHVVALVDDLEHMLVYIWRRQLTAALARALADAAPEAPGAEQRIIGFADLVNFTAVVRRMTERQLGHLVVRFETLAQDVITAHGGRLVKTVGDEVMFSHNDARAAAGIALDLVEAMAEEPLLPPVRVGMATGPVLSRFGDVYGTTVNRAARLTSIAPTGGVLIDDALAKRVAAVSGFQLTSERRRVLRGIGGVTPSRLHRSTGDRAADDAPVPLRPPPVDPVGGDGTGDGSSPEQASAAARWYDAG